MIDDKLKIQVVVHYWFQKSYGNTYHKVYVTGDCFFSSKIEYGYGNGWELTLCKLLTQWGLVSERTKGMAPLTWIKGHGIGITNTHIVEVTRKKDL